MNFFRKHWPLFIIILLGLVPLIWFKDGLIIAGGDNFVYLDPSANFYNNIYSWFDKLDSGMPSMEKPKLFPFSFFWFLGKKIGLSLINIQRFWTVFHFMFPGIFMYLLIRFLYKSSDKNGKSAALIGSVFYMFNFLVITDAFQVTLRPLSVFLPLILLFWMKGLSQNRFSLKHVFALALTSIFYGSANLNIASVSSLYIILFAYFIYFIFTTKRYKHAFTFVFLAVFSILLVNMWWLPNFYFSVVKASKELMETTRSFNFLKVTPISEAFRVMGFWAFRTMNGENPLIPLIPFALSFYRLPLLFLTFTVPFLGFASFLFVSKNKEKLFFLFLVLLGLFLAKGANPPFGFIYQFLYDKIPSFSAYREPFTKFTLISVFAYSVLIGFFSGDFLNFLKGKTKNSLASVFFLIILTVVILFNSYPLVLGKNIQSKDWYGDANTSLFVKIPDYWQEASSWFKKYNSKSKVILFPKTYYGQKYNWELGIITGHPVAVQFLPNPLIRNIDTVANGENRLAQLVYLSLYLGKNVNLFPYFDLFAIDFVLQQNDIFPHDDIGVFNPLTMYTILNNQKSLKPIITFGRLNFKPVEGLEALKVYSVSRDYPSKQVYLPEEVIYVFGKLESFPDIFSLLPYKSSQSYFFSEDQIVLGDLLPKIGSKVLINLKNKRETGETSADFLYKFTVPRSANYKLLINEYLFESASKKNDKKVYYLSLDNKNLSTLGVIGGWRLADLGVLTNGTHVIQTNLPVNEITDYYLTSPFWLVEDTMPRQSLLGFSREFLSYDKINPSKYRVKIKGGNNPFVLVLSETYNQEWQVYYDGKVIKADHFLINGYANGWYLEPSFFKEGEELTLEIIYRPQKIADIGDIISVIVVFLLVSGIILMIIKEKKL